MSDLLSIIQESANPDPVSLGKILDRSPEDVEKELKSLKDDGILMGWVPLINPSQRGGRTSESRSLRLK